MQPTILAALAKVLGSTIYRCNYQGDILATTAGAAEREALAAVVTHCVRQAAAVTDSVMIHDDLNMVTWRFEQWILVSCNSQIISSQQRFRQIMEEALPFIAQVAGGTAVLFNQDGIREQVIQPDGQTTPGALGAFNQLCQQVMKELRPSIGPSVLSPGATAVRIPLTTDYGLAFNNTYAAGQRQRLLDNVRRHGAAHYQLEDIIGDCPAMSEVKALAREVAASLSTVLISGETGTGKELFAQAIHNLSPRCKQPFIAINCGALPAELVESTFFGYADGAFTGAKKGGQAGVFEQADGGTLFLDEISEMPYPLQVKLLRALQEREVSRVGDGKTIAVDVRIIASTNKSLPSLVEQQRFRADLFFRLNVFEVVIPPLRERNTDLVALTDYFIKKFSRLLGKTIEEITPKAMQALSAYAWPGNVRELQNCLEYAIHMIGVQQHSLTSEHLPQRLRRLELGVGSEGSHYAQYMQRIERELITNVLAACDNNKSEAARRLGLNRTTLWRILKRQGLLP